MVAEADGQQDRLDADADHIDAPQPGACAAGRRSIDTYRLLVRLAVKLDKNNVPATRGAGSCCRRS
jgi:hypothetical protein